MSVLANGAGDVRTPVLNVAEGGQQGIMTNPFYWSSSSNYVRQKLLCVLISSPELMKYLPESKQQVAALKSLMELMPQKVDGLKSTLTWEYDGPAVGNAGEKFVSALKGTREVSAPTYSWAEKYGQAIARFWTELGRCIILDPDLQVPGIVAEAAYIAANSPPILPEQQAIIMLFIEPDLTMTNVGNAWLCTNMMPLTGGEIIGSREIGGGAELTTVDIEFTAFTQTGKAVWALAKNYLNSLKLTDLRPLELQPFADGISPTVDAAQLGLAREVTEAVMSA